MKRCKIKYGNKCSFCDLPTVAVWMTGGMSSIQEYACQEHKSEIYQDDGYMTEGDRQSWYIGAIRAKKKV